MDLECIRCGEPWDIYEVNHEFSVIEKTKFVAGQGCPCCDGREIEVDEIEATQQVSRLGYNIMNDDDPDRWLF